MTAIDESTRYCFIGDWYDPQAAMTRKYQIFTYPKDGSVEIFDASNRRTFLRKTKYEALKPADFYLGNVVNIYSRQMTLSEYGDDFTRRALSSTQESTLALIKPDAIRSKADILQSIIRDGFKIVNMQTVHLSRGEAEGFYAIHKGKPFYNDLITLMTSGCTLALELMRPNAIMRWRDLAGPTSSVQARSQDPGSVRARFGTDNTRNAVHGSDSPESAQLELEFFFPRSASSSAKCGRGNTARVNDTTLCVLKPTLFKQSSAVAEVIGDIERAGFSITAMKTFTLEKSDAEEFLEVYKGVVSEYADMVLELSSGTCLALEVAADGDPTKFRAFVGPADPEIARHLRPNTLRAKFGSTKVNNGLHVTDLADDALLEVEYFFRILSR